MDSVSTLGYGLGYIGGSTIPLLIFLIMNAVGVPMLTSLAIIFAITAVWWLVFSLPLLKKLRADHRQAPMKRAMSAPASRACSPR